jgi:L-lactate dehydrogenase complex protein LldG
MSTTGKNNILKKIQAALTTSTRLPFPASEGRESVFQPLQQDIVVEFAEQFTQLQGKFDFCIDDRELALHFGQLCIKNEWTKIYCEDETLKTLLPGINWYSDVESCDAAITCCEALG